MKTKKAITLTIDQDDLQVCRHFCEKTGQSISGMVDTYINAMAATIRAARLDKKEVVTKVDLLKLGLKGIRQTI